MFGTATAQTARPFSWDNATVYFLLTDRFNNADPANDHAYGRKDDAATLRGFMGGDLAGVTAKIKAGYFTELGVDALWITPPVEQIHETARQPNVDGAEGDARLRSFMNWNELATFKRTYDKGGVRDRVVVASGLPLDRDTAVSVRGVFADGQTVRDDYSGQSAVVADGRVRFAARNAVVLIAQD